VPLDALPAVPKDEAHIDNSNRPDRRAGEIEKEKRPIGHAKQPGQNSREHAKACDEPARKDGPLAVFQEQCLGTIKGLCYRREFPDNSVNESPAAKMTDEESQ